MSNKKAVIAMSGGVDSSVAAYLMKSMGYECMGVTMKLFDNEDIGISRERSCCSFDDIDDARSVAYKLDIPYFVFNFSDRFKKEVIERFIKSYENGLTPNPCIDCNRYLKFDKLFLRAQELDYDYVVTGHYAKVAYDEQSGRYLLKKSDDSHKDQSYVLYSLTQNQLAHALFPLGDKTKQEVRKIAGSQGFVNEKKRDSQDICFVQNGRYVDFIKQYTNKVYPKGNFIDVNNKILGVHNGIINYTVGQRKGLGVSFGEPMYVKSVKPEDNTVTLAKEKDLYSSVVTATDINLISVDNIKNPIRIKAKTRYNHSEQWATAVQIDDDVLQVKFDLPQRAVTKGQAIVLYDGDVVVGGGTIS